MADLMARSALAGLDLPLLRGAAMLGQAQEVPMLAIAPFRGREAAVAALFGGELPGPGLSVDLAGFGTLHWSGHDQWLLCGPGATEALAEQLAPDAAAVDVTDGWAGLILAGAGVRAVLARLVPVDLDPDVLPAGGVARTLLRHIPCLLAMRDDDVLILVPRSYASSAVADLVRAMEAVAARVRS